MPATRRKRKGSLISSPGVARQGSDGPTESSIDLAPLVAAATGLVGGIGALTLTGALGRVQRNHGTGFAIAIGLVVLGAAIVAGAALINDGAGDVKLTARSLSGKGWIVLGIIVAFGLGGLIGFIALSSPDLDVFTSTFWRVVCGMAVAAAAIGVLALLIDVRFTAHQHQPGLTIGVRRGTKVAGTLLAAAGLILGFLVAILATGETEQPTVTLALGPDGNSVTATAKVGDLPSPARMSVFIDGLTELPTGGSNPDATLAQVGQLLGVQPAPTADVRYTERTVLYKAFIGPDTNGDIADSATVRIPPHRFDAIAVIAYTTPNSSGCTDTLSKKQAGTGCAVIRLPDRSGSPGLAATWEGTRSIKVDLQSSAGRYSQPSPTILLRATGLDAQRHHVLLYAGVIHPLTTSITNDIHIPVPTGLRMVCVDAAFAPARPAPTLSAQCPIRSLARRPLTSQSAVELAPVRSTTTNAPEKG